MGLVRDTFRHTAIYSLATLSGRLASFVLLPFYAYMFNTEGYGILGILDASVSLLAIPLAAGFHNAILKFYHEEEGSRKGLAITTALWMAWGLSTALIAVPLVASPAISAALLGNREYYPLLCLALITFVVEVGAQTSSTYLVINQRSALYSVVGLLQLIVTLGLNVWLVLILQIGLIGFLISSLASAGVSLVAFLWGPIREFGVRFDRTLALQILRFQLPLVPGDLVAYISRQAERFFVRMLEGLNSVGVLEMGYKFPPVLNLLIVHPFLRAWQTKYFEIAGSDEGPSAIGKMFTSYFYALVLFGLLLAVNIENVLVMLTPPAFWPATRIARMEIVTTVLTGVTSYLALGLLYRGSTGKLGLIRFIAAPVKVFFAFLFISFLGVGGAAYSACIVQLGLVLAIGASAQSIFPIALEHRKLLVIAGTALIMDSILNGMRYESFDVAVRLRSALGTLASHLESTSLGAWRGGKLIELFSSREERLVATVLNTFFLLPFLILFPIINLDFGRKLMRSIWPRRSGRRSL